MKSGKLRRSGYEIAPFPRVRQLIIDSGRFASRKHNIRCLIEIDITKGRQFIREHRAMTGGILSFTAYVIACLARAVDENRQIHAYRNWQNQLIIFDDVDVITYVEVELKGRKFPLAHIVRSANRKTWRQIHEEIRCVQADPEQSASAQLWSSMKWFLMLPAFVRQIFYRFMSRRPHLWKKYVGTVYLTGVGMFGKAGGWGIGFSAHTLGIILGGISEKPVAVEGQIEIRECLNVTADFDHDLIDGAPAARFIEKFKARLESGNGFDTEPE